MVFEVFPALKANGVEMSDYDYVECRSLRHAWKPYTARRLGPNTVERTLACMRCGCLRDETFSIDAKWGTLEKTKNRYEYPKGYVIKRGEVSVSEFANTARLYSILSQLAASEN